MMPTLLSLVVKDVVMTNTSATSDKKVVILMTLFFSVKYWIGSFVLIIESLNWASIHLKDTILQL